jgi:hypothetical protein
MCKIAAILSLGVHLHRSGRASDRRFAEWAGWLPRYVELIERRGG